MQRLSTHLRGLLVALAALALTAGVAFAARPTGTTGLERATDAAGKTVPTTTEEEEPTIPEVDEDEDTDEDGEEAVDEDGSEAEDGDEDDGRDEALDDERADNHGWYVSEAAKAETPEGYKNHGEYVSEIARSDAGKPGAEDEDADEARRGRGRTGDEAEATTAKVKGKDRAAQNKTRHAERKAHRGK